MVLFLLALVIRFDRHHIGKRISPPVIVLSIASLNSDEARPPKSMPSLSGMAAYSLVFTRASTCIPDTLGSNATLLTGAYPDAHGLGLRTDAKLPSTVTTLAEM